MNKIQDDARVATVISNFQDMDNEELVEYYEGYAIGFGIELLKNGPRPKEEHIILNKFKDEILKRINKDEA